MDGNRPGPGTDDLPDVEAVRWLWLAAHAAHDFFDDELGQAAAFVDEIAAVTEMTDNRLPPYGALALAARQGRAAKASELIRKTREQLVPRGEGMGLTLTAHAEAVFFNGLGRYEEALVTAEDGAQHPQELGFATLALPELVEAAGRSRHPARAAGARKRLAVIAWASGTDWP